MQHGPGHIAYSEGNICPNINKAFVQSAGDILYFLRSQYTENTIPSPAHLHLHFSYLFNCKWTKYWCGERRTCHTSSDAHDRAVQVKCPPPLSTEHSCRTSYHQDSRSVASPLLALAKRKTCPISGMGDCTVW